MEQEECNRLPTRLEIIEIMLSLKNRKAAGPDGISAEYIKFAGQNILTEVADIIIQCWKSGAIPSAWQQARIAPIYKGSKAGSEQDCSAHRGISLINVGAKIRAHSIQKRIEPMIERRLQESQNGFRRNRGVDDGMFCIRRIVEKARITRTTLYVLYIDIRKAYDCIPRDVMWITLEKMNIGGRVSKTLRRLYENITAEITDKYGTSAHFAQNVGLRQGCSTSPIIFNAIMDAILRTTFNEQTPGIKINWRIPHGKKHMGQQVSGIDTIGPLAYADDLVLYADDPKELKEAFLNINLVMKQWGMTMNEQKTKCQVIQPLDAQQIFFLIPL